MGTDFSLTSFPLFIRQLIQRSSGFGVAVEERTVLPSYALINTNKLMIPELLRIQLYVRFRISLILMLGDFSKMRTFLLFMKANKFKANNIYI